MIIQLIVVCTSLYFVYQAAVFISTMRHRKRLLAHLPGPPQLPVVGSMFHINRFPENMPQGVCDRARQAAAKGFDLVCVWFVHHCIIMPITGASVKAILDSNEELTKGSDYDMLVPWLGRGLLVSSGDKWRARRRMLTPTFHFTMLDSYISKMNYHARIFVEDILVDHARQEKDIYPLIKRCTLDIICDTAMGKLLDAQHNPNHPYVTAVGTIVRLVVEIVARPILWTATMRKLLGVEGEYRKNVELAHNFTKTVVQQRIEALSRGEVEKSKRAFLDLLIDQMATEKLTIEDLREEVDTFMFEGYDTTASGLSWSVWCLATHPEYQEKAYEEIKEIFSDDPEREATREDLHKMNFTERCIKEALRMFPPVPIVMRKLQKDFMSGNTLIPAGVNINICPLAIHRNANIYPSPNSYDPDRFLPEAASERHPFDYIPFSAGARNCIGQKFAMYEEKVVLSWLLRKYKFETNLNLLDNPPLAEGVLRPKLGCLVTLVPR